ncbi:MAG: ABC transporter ATP-binding protein [Christensenellales bacterium]|jgi:ATP-binding cassette subfamily B multidrug efflux pump
MKKIASYLKPYFIPVLLAPLFMLLEVAMDLAQPTLMSQIVDIGLPGGDMTFILTTGAKMLGAAAIGLVGGIGCVYFSAKASQNFGADLRKALFNKIQSFSFAGLDIFGTASLVTRLTNDVQQIQLAVMMMMRIMVRAPFLMIGGVILAFTINAKLALILVVSMPLLFVVISLILRKGLPYFTATQKKLDKVNGVIQENLTGIRVIKAFVREEHEKKRFNTANTDLTDIMIKAGNIMALAMPLMTLFTNLAIIAAIWFGGSMAAAGEMQVGKIMAFISYVMQILMSLMIVSFMLVFYSRAKVSADRVAEVLNTPTDIEDGKGILPQPKGEIEFRNVSFKYPGAGGEPLLQDVSFSIKSGQTIGILGSTGAGKSSLVNLIPRFYDVDGGAVLLDGVDVRDYKLDELRGRIGMVLQDNILFSGTIRDNLKWGNDNASDDELIAATKDAQAYSFISTQREGLDTVLGQRGVNISGGQKQRLAIARALVKKPAVLILDDSTSAVDLGTEAEIQNALESMHDDRTVIVIAQRISSVMKADRILVIEDGSIVADGRHEELIKSSAIYRDIYSSQMGKEAV